MTVDEAKKKECITKVWNGDGDGFIKCSADNCMAWQWHITITDSGDKGIKENTGYCGMVRG